MHHPGPRAWAHRARVVRDGVRGAHDTGGGSAAARCGEAPQAARGSGAAAGRRAASRSVPRGALACTPHGHRTHTACAQHIPHRVYTTSHTPRLLCKVTRRARARLLSEHALVDRLGQPYQARAASIRVKALRAEKAAALLGGLIHEQEQAASSQIGRVGKGRVVRRGLERQAEMQAYAAQLITAATRCVRDFLVDYVAQAAILTMAALMTAILSRAPRCAGCEGLHARMRMRMRMCMCMWMWMWMWMCMCMCMCMRMCMCTASTRHVHRVHTAHTLRGPCGCLLSLESGSGLGLGLGSGLGLGVRGWG